MSSDQQKLSVGDSPPQTEDGEQNNALSISHRLLSESNDREKTAKPDRQSTGAALPDVAIIDKGAKDVVRDAAKDVPKEREEKTSWRGKEVILRSTGGLATYFKDESGREWESDDGKRWKEKGTDDAWHGSISIDSSGVLQKDNSSYGVKSSFHPDGSQTKSFTSKDGTQIKIFESVDGKKQLEDGSRVWQSADGKNWSSGTLMQRASIDIDEYGRLRKNTGRAETTLNSSAETHAIVRTMWRMESTYNVKFSLPGELVDYRDDSKTKVPMRMPTSDELKVMEEVLDQFKHLSNSARRTDFDGLKIGFTAFKDNGKSVNVAGWHDNSPEGIFFGPTIFKNARGVKGLEGVALHELTHELQNKFWKEDEIPKKVLDFFGYEKAPKQNSDDDDSYRLKDKDGNQWQYLLTNKTDSDGIWMPVRNGEMSTDRSEGISDNAMREKLPEGRRPATEYFFDPEEAHADALALYLYEPAALYDTNPHLYWAVKEWDQADINRRYKTIKNRDGSETPLMIRGADGKIVPNSQDNRRKVEEAQSSMYLSTPSFKPSEAHKEGVCSCHGNRKSKGKAEKEQNKTAKVR